MADITVQVSSAGLTAYGASDWGSQTYGGDQSTSTTLGSADAFNNEGWGRLSWGSLTWDQDFENQTIQVTTPGKGTVWGSDVWGDAEWGQISGMDTDQGSVQATISVAPSITGEQLNTTVNNVVSGASALVTPSVPAPNSSISVSSVFGGELNVVQVSSPSNDEWGTEPYGQGFWGVGDGITIFIGTETEHIADANVYPSGTQASFQAVGTVEVPVVIENGFELTLSQGDAFGGELVVVEVSSPTNDEWGTEYWGAGQWGVGDGITIIIGTETENTGTGSVTLTGEEINVTTDTLEQASIYSFTGEELNISTDGVFGGPNIEVQVRTASAVNWGYAPYGEGQWGQGVGTDIGIGGEEVATPSIEVNVTGIPTTTNVEDVSISGTATLDLTGIEITTFIGDEDAFTNVTAQVSGQQIGPFVIGDYAAGISILVEPIGVTSTASTGIIGLNAWAVVDPGNAPTWTVVDIAA